MKKFLTLALLIGIATTVSAQWSVGVGVGLDNTKCVRQKSFDYDRNYIANNGLATELTMEYTLLPWLGVRSGVDFLYKNYSMERGQERVTMIKTHHKNSYLQLPLMADLQNHFGHFTAHLYLGGYAGWWLQHRANGRAFATIVPESEFDYTEFDEKMEFNSTRDQRFNAGLLGGLGATYDITEHWCAGINALYYYDLVSSTKDYMRVADPHYYNTLNLELIVNYTF